MKFMVLVQWKGLGNCEFVLNFKHGLLNTKTNTNNRFTKDMPYSCRDESFYTTVQMCFYNRSIIRHIKWESQPPWIVSFESFNSLHAFKTHDKVYTQVHVSVLMWIFNTLFRSPYETWDRRYGLVVEAESKVPEYRRTQLWGSVPALPRHWTWTSRNHGLYHPGGWRDNVGSETIRSWFRPHRCKERWCRRYLWWDIIIVSR